MARVVESLPKKSTPGGAVKKSWVEPFLDGKVYELKRGEDFTCATSTAHTHVHHVATKRGLRVLCRTAVIDGAELLYVQVVGKR